MSDAHQKNAAHPGSTPQPDGVALNTSDQTKALPDIREARMAELRKQYLDGSYEVDSTTLSAKIIDDLLRESDVNI